MMARMKSSPEAYHNPPHPESLPSSSAPAPEPKPILQETPSASFTSTGSTSSPQACPSCEEVFSESQTQEFHDHVAECLNRSHSPDSCTSSLSTLSSHSPEPVEARETETSENATPILDSFGVSLGGSGNVSGSQSVVGHNASAYDANNLLVIRPAIAQSNGSRGPSAVIGSDLEDAELESLFAAGGDAASKLVAPYALPLVYEYYAENENHRVQVVETSEAGDAASTMTPNSPNPEAPVRLQKEPDADTAALELPDPITPALPPLISRTNSGFSEIASTSDDPVLLDGAMSVGETAEDAETNVNHVPIIHEDSPVSSTPLAALQPAITPTSNPAPANRQGPVFKKLQPIEHFVKYLADPEQLSYETLYQRASNVEDALYVWQTEWDDIDAELKAFELQRRTQKKFGDDEAKEQREKQQEADDIVLLALHQKFSKELKYNGREWRNFIVEWVAMPKSADQQREFDLLKTLRNAATISGVQKRQAQAQKKENSNPEYDNLLLPKLTKEDTESYIYKRKLTIDPQMWEDKKQADVLGFTWSKDEKHIGKQPLRIRRGNDLSIEMSADRNEPTAEENGRPQRLRAKKAMYDTEQSEAANSDGEELPSKRRRVQRAPDGSSLHGSGPGTREGSPAVKTFASGKRVGRPPGSKTKPKPAKSKLQSVQVPPGSETPENEQADEEIFEEQHIKPKKIKQSLAPNEEAQLQDAAESLASKIADEAAPTPVKRKHPGGRPKKGALAETSSNPASSNAPAQDDAPASSKPKKGSRVKKNTLPTSQPELLEDSPKTSKVKAKGPKSSRIKKEPLSEKVRLGDDDILPSTEQDEGSQFSSASTSRPSTSSSVGSNSPFESGRPARTKNDDPRDGDGETPAKKRRGGKGKLAKDPASPVRSHIIILNMKPQDGDAPRKRNSRVERSQSGNKAATADTSELGEGSSSGRPKRKRVSTYSEIPDDNEIEEAAFADPPLPKKRKTRPTKKVAGKGKSARIDETSDEEEEFDEKSEVSVPPSTMKRVPRKAAPKTLKIEEFDGITTPEEDKWVYSPEPIEGEPEVEGKPAPKRKSLSNGKGSALSFSLEPTYFSQPSTPTVFSNSNDLSILDDKDAEAARKKAQKSAKLSASAKRRWESGAMAGPMAKRKATNDAKKAQRAATKAAIANGQQPIQVASSNSTPTSIAPSPYSAPPPPEVETSPSGPRVSGRVRKPSRLALGIDGTGDLGLGMHAHHAHHGAHGSHGGTSMTINTNHGYSHHHGYGGDAAANESHQSQDRSFKSEYEQFQALSSPKDPLVLAKRVRKTTYDWGTSKGYGADDYDEDEDDEE